MANHVVRADQHHALANCLGSVAELEFAVLFGSRATGQAHATSDWDIAVKWQDVPSDSLEYFGRVESLRQSLAECLNIDPTDVDVVDLQRTGLALRAAVAEEGIPMVGEDSLAWALFLKRTWQDMEHWELEKRYAP